MKLGLNIYAGMANEENLRFARQVGATHIVAHLPAPEDMPSSHEGVWSYEDLLALRRRVESAGLKLEAIENFRPEHWDQVLLGGPGRDRQMACLHQTIRNMGRAGIPAMGYYFSLAGVWGRVEGPFARAGARSVGYIREQAPPESPIPRGEVWNTKIPETARMGIDQDAGEEPEDPAKEREGIGTVTAEQMWERLEYFLTNLVPVAEEAGVRLAAHPDDPPLPTLRGIGRLITHPEYYQRLLDIAPSRHNGLEFCQGTIAEMSEGSVYDAIRKYAPQDRIVYVHFRNVRGKVPHYEEVFIDEGDVDMIECLRLYHEGGFRGVVVPDHTPYTACAAPWHAGMAFALGYMKAALTMLGALEE